MLSKLREFLKIFIGSGGEHRKLVRDYWNNEFRNFVNVARVRQEFGRWRDTHTRYFNDLRKYLDLTYQSGIKEPVELRPMLNEWTTETAFDSHYVYQGPWLFERLLQTKPTSHVDVASYIGYMGFISAVIPTTFIDIRPTRAKFKNFKEKVGSVLKLPYQNDSVESLSCLHVIEHVGLGRYGDPIDVSGLYKSTQELKRVLAHGGNLFVSLPVGKHKVTFNAHRVTDPEIVLKYFHGLKLVELSAIDDKGNFIRNVKIDVLRNSSYACGLFWFRKD